MQLLRRFKERHRRRDKVKGTIHCVSAAHALEAEVRRYDHPFTEPNPDAKDVITAYLEQGMRHALPDEKFQFARHGYFVADRVDSKPGKPVFNRMVTFKDSWGK